MKQNRKVATVFIRSDSKVGLGLSAAERASIARASGSDFEVFFLPPVTKDQHKHTASFELQSTVVVFFLGVAFATVIKPFMEAIAAEAGKDFWTAAKKLVSRIVHRQSAKSYHLSARVYFVFEEKDEHIAISIKLGHLDEGAPVKKIEEALEVNLSGLGEALAPIASVIKRFNVGQREAQVSHSSQVHIIEKREGKWQIYPIDGADIFGQHMVLKDE